jgi:hypothetical protein
VALALSRRFCRDSLHASSRSGSGSGMTRD